MNIILDFFVFFLRTGEGLINYSFCSSNQWKKRELNLHWGQKKFKKIFLVHRTPASPLWILGRVDARSVDRQRRHSLKCYLSLNLGIRFECLYWHRRHVELCICWLKLLIGLVAVGIGHSVVHHRWRRKCLLELLLSFGWLLWRIARRLLIGVRAELIHVIHRHVKCWRRSWSH